jgi:hypothetical protein
MDHTAAVGECGGHLATMVTKHGANEGWRERKEMEEEEDSFRHFFDEEL